MAHTGVHDSHTKPNDPDMDITIVLAARRVAELEQQLNNERNAKQHAEDELLRLSEYTMSKQVAYVRTNYGFYFYLLPLSLLQSMGQQSYDHSRFTGSQASFYTPKKSLPGASLLT